MYCSTKKKILSFCMNCALMLFGYEKTYNLFERVRFTCHSLAQLYGLEFWCLMHNFTSVGLFEEYTQS